jgi:hypothetical protein
MLTYGGIYFSLQNNDDGGEGEREEKRGACGEGQGEGDTLVGLSLTVGQCLSCGPLGERTLPIVHR